MLAMNFRGPYKVRSDRNRPMPEIEHPYDAIVRVTRSLVCDSDLHLVRLFYSYRALAKEEFKKKLIL